jgi:hypothetical protein
MQQKTSIDENIEFLNEVYKNSQAGSESISYLKEKVDDKQLLLELQNELTEYQNIQQRVTKLMANYKAVPKEQTPMAQMGMWTGVQMNTLLDKSPDKIAEMMIEGATMGIVDMTRSLKEHREVPEEARKIGSDLIAVEERTIQNMKRYLTHK